MFSGGIEKQHLAEMGKNIFFWMLVLWEPVNSQTLDFLDAVLLVTCSFYIKDYDELKIKKLSF